MPQPIPIRRNHRSKVATAYFDCYSGISGDMVLGALVDLGLSIDDLREALKSLPVGGYEVDSTRVSRCGIGATLVRVNVTEKQPHRHLSAIEKIIGESTFNEHVKTRALAAFRLIGEAEAEIHGVPIEKIHFHEVGAVDAIVDIVGAIWGMDRLGVQRVLASPVAVGSGTVHTAHGEMPVPAPATARILQGVPVFTGPIAAELTTPTGAAILRTVASVFGPMEGFRIQKTAYGAGSREHPGQTNYLRVHLGEDSGPALPVESRKLAIVQTEIDDMPGEVFGHVFEQLFAAGCLDVHMTSVQMKKQRPGTSIQALVDPADVDRIIEILLRQTSTVGVKVVPCDRYCLARRFEEIETDIGRIKVKVGLWGGEVLKATPEYEDCRRIAGQTGLPLSAVFLRANAAIMAKYGELK